MPDITMCQPILCPMAARCHRATAKPSPYYQSYFVQEPWNGKECDSYWPNETPEVTPEVKEKNA